MEHELNNIESPQGSTARNLRHGEETLAGQFQRRITPIVLLGLLTFATVFAFASIDTFSATDLTLQLNRRFMEGLSQFREYLSYFDFLVLGIAGLLFWKFGIAYGEARRVLKVFFLFAAVCLTLDLINPNAAAERMLGLALLGDVRGYVYLIFLFVVFFIPDDALIVTLRYLFSMLVGVIIVRCGILFLLWLAGKGNYAFGANSILTEADSLFVLALVCSVSLGLFLTSRKPWYFISWAVPFVVQVLSFRRSAMFVVLLCNGVTVMIYIWLSGGGLQLVRNIIVLVLGLGVIYLALSQMISQDVLQFYTLRYFGMFTDVGADRTSLMSDSGHFEESRSTLQHAFGKGEFWGYGFGDSSRINVPGATRRLWVHNVYAAAWLYQGFYMFLFYVFLFSLAVFLLVNVLRHHAENERAYTMVVSSVITFLIMMMVAWYTNPIHMAQSLKMRVFWSMIVAFTLKVSPGNFGLLFKRAEK